MSLVLFLLLFPSVLFYFLTPDERRAVLRTCLAWCQRGVQEAIRRWNKAPRDDRMPDPPLPFVTWAIVIVNLWVFVRMFFGEGAFGDHETLVSWGGSFGPRTTNGEWWRLVSAMFVHQGPLHLAATLAGLIQIGIITERLVGHCAFASIYIGAGTLANLVCLSRSPVAMNVGGAGGVLGIHGLLLATSTWGLLRGSPVGMPWDRIKRLLPGIAFFLLYTSITGRLDRLVAAAAVAGGAVGGFVLAKGARDHKPAARRIAVLTADTAALIMLFAIPLRGMADVTPEVTRVIATEQRTASTYQVALDRFTKSAIPAAALAQVIDDRILPQLQAARAAIEALERVPPEDRSVVADAREYLRLRDESWRLRSEALRKSRSALLKEADRREWQSLDLLARVRDVDLKHRER